MRWIDWRVAGSLACLALVGACTSYTPRPGLQSYRGEFPVPHGSYVEAGFESPYPSSYAPPFIEPSRTYPADHHWYTADEYRDGHYGYGYAPEPRSHAHERYGYAEERHGPSHRRHGYAREHHEYQYTYKYKFRGRVIKPDHFYVWTYDYGGFPGRPVPQAYSHDKSYRSYEKRSYEQRDYRY